MVPRSHRRVCASPIEPLLRSRYCWSGRWLDGAPCTIRLGTDGLHDSLLERDGFEPVWGFSCQVVFLVCRRFFVRSGKAVLHPVACDRFAERAEGGKGPKR